MLRTALIALSATAAMAVALAPSAQAKTHVDFNIGIGVPGGYIAVGEPAPDYGYYDAGYGYGSYDDDCHYVKVKHKKWLPDGTKKVWFSKELVCY